jgi:pyridoxal phosphate enzyme (YggS family)
LISGFLAALTFRLECARCLRLWSARRNPEAPLSLDEIRSRIATALARAGRPADAVRLIAVSKLQPAERVRAVLEAGHRIFGENRVQEAEGRWPPLRDVFGPVELHLVGPLQTNKLARALGLFDAIHSLDRDSLARKLAAAVQARGACPTLFVQVNTGREPQKAGVDPDALDGFLVACREAYDLPIAGLMCIPPVEADPVPHFQALAAMAARNGLPGLSMGMSDDVEAAIACGATHVRVGSAIFGTRPVG